MHAHRGHETSGHKKTWSAHTHHRRRLLGSLGCQCTQRESSVGAWHPEEIRPQIQIFLTYSSNLTTCEAVQHKYPTLHDLTIVLLSSTVFEDNYRQLFKSLAVHR